ncbi:hypothetical protein [Escherichia coli]|uniref:hypothetical protein n=1 Tax=Escherichia coli TaxID=562 RepID=UPI00388F3EEE
MIHSNLLNEVASIGLVDPLWYAKEYPDVVKTGIDPVEHYILNMVSILKENLHRHLTSIIIKK